MKNLHIIIFMLFCNTLFSQALETVKFYQLKELEFANKDSVIAIDLKKMNLTEVPEIIYQYDKLEYLNLSKNKLQKINNLESFKHLKYLNLEKNKLIYFPISICQLNKLETLIINRNDITTIPSCIGYCESLEFIDLWNTAINSFPKELSSLKNLKKIDLSGVQINKQNQEKMRNLLPNVKLILDAPCNCTQ